MRYLSKLFGTSLTAFQIGINGPFVTQGTGSPEGVVVGSVGDMYLRTNGSVNATLYVKQVGTATNTGWSPMGAGASPYASITVLPVNASAYPSYGIQTFTDLNAAWASIPRPDLSYPSVCNDWVVIIPAGVYTPASDQYQVRGCTVSGDAKVYQWGATLGAVFLNGTTSAVGVTITGLSSTTNLYAGMVAYDVSVFPATLVGTVSTIDSPTQVSLVANAPASGARNLVFSQTGMAISGTGVPGGATIVGAGLSAAKFISGANGVSVTAGSNVVTFQGTSTTAGLHVGQEVSTSNGQHLPYSLITEITDGTHIKVSQNALATGNNLSLSAASDPYVIMSAPATSTNYNANYTVEYPLWLRASTAIGSNRVRVNYVADALVGQAVTGSGIPGGTTITAIEYVTGADSAGVIRTNSGVLTLSANATATAIVTLAVPVGAYFVADLWARRIMNIALGPVQLGRSDALWNTATNTSSQPASTTNASALVTGLTDTTLLFVGQQVYGNNVPSGTTISAITGGTTLTLSGNASATGATTLTFGVPLSNFWTPSPGVDHFIDLCLMPGTTPVIYGLRPGFHWEEMPGAADAWTTHEAYISKSRLNGSVRWLDSFSASGGSPIQQHCFADLEVFGNPALTASFYTPTVDTGASTNSNTTLTLSGGTIGLQPGQSVSGGSIPADTYIASIQSNTSLTMTKAATTTAAATVTFGNTGSSAVSFDGSMNTGGTINLLAFYKGRSRGIVNCPTRFELGMAENYEFSGYVNVLQYTHLHDCALKAGMTWTANSANYDCPGFSDCQVVSTAAYTGVAAARLRLDGYTNYWFQSAAAVLGTNTSKTILENSSAGAVSLTGQTATIATTTLYSPPADGLYQIPVYASCTAAGAGSATITIGWTDDGGAKTLSLTVLPLTATTGFVQQTVTVRAKSGTNITYAVAYVATGTFEFFASAVPIN